MTTIAYKNGFIASDSRATCGSEISGGVARKLVVSEKHGCIYAMAGSFHAAQAFVRILESLDRLPWANGFEICVEHIDLETFNVLVLQHDGRLFLFDYGHWGEIFAESYAMGSGGQAAQAAMLLGADPLQAIKIASMVDVGTDDRITCYEASELKPPAYLTARGRARSPQPRSRRAPAAPSPSKSRSSRKKP